MERQKIINHGGDKGAKLKIAVATGNDSLAGFTRATVTGIRHGKEEQRLKTEQSNSTLSKLRMNFEVSLYILKAYHKTTKQVRLAKVGYVRQKNRQCGQKTELLLWFGALLEMS